MKERENTLPPGAKRFLTDALGRLVQLYDAWGNKDKAEECRKKLSAKEGAK